MRPKIGIIICGVQDHRHFVSDSYIKAVERSGGLPLVIPMTAKVYRDYLSLCDGFLFCGGDDINSILYKREPAPNLGKTDLHFDLFQLQTIRLVLETKKPLLAICRGIQLLNVACGGTLIQNLNTNHMQNTTCRSDIFHSISVNRHTLLHQILNDKLFVNSYHHQAIDIIGRGLIISAISKDKTIEAIEKPSHPFVVGVQWHPECMYQTSANMRNLFHTFIYYSR